MAFCTKCGAKIPDGAKFCNSCGEKLGNSPTSTEEKIVAFVENFDVKEKISDLKKFSESSKEIAEIKEKISEVKKAAESSEQVAEIKGKISEAKKAVESSEQVAEIKGKIFELKKAAESSEQVAEIKDKISEAKKAVESSEQVAEIKEKLQSNEKVAAFLEKVSWKKLLAGATVIFVFAILKIFGGDDSLGITPEKFKDRYNRNLQVMFKDKSKYMEITDIKTEKSGDDSMAVHFINRTGVPIIAFHENGNKNLYSLCVAGSTSNELFLGVAAISAYSAVNKGTASENDIFKTTKMVQNLIGNALKNSGSKTMDSDIVEDGIRYGFGAVNDRKDAKMFFVIQTEEHFLSSQKKNAEGRDFK